MTEKRYLSLLEREVTKTKKLLKDLEGIETFGDIIKYGMFEDKVHTMMFIPKIRINYQNFVPINSFPISKEKIWTVQNNVDDIVKSIYQSFKNILDLSNKLFELKIAEGIERQSFLYSEALVFLRNIHFHHKYTKHKMNYICDISNYVYYFKTTNLDEKKLFFQIVLSEEDIEFKEKQNALNMIDVGFSYGMLNTLTNSEYFKYNSKIDDYLSAVPKNIIFLDVHTATSVDGRKNYNKLVKINVSIEELLDYIFPVGEFKILLQK